MQQPFYPLTSGDAFYGETWTPRFYQAGYIFPTLLDNARFSWIGDMVFFQGSFQPKTSGTGNNTIYIEMPAPVPRRLDSESDGSNNSYLGTGNYTKPGSFDTFVGVVAPGLTMPQTSRPNGDRWASFWLKGTGALGSSSNFAVGTTDIITMSGFYFTAPWPMR